MQVLDQNVVVMLFFMGFIMMPVLMIIHGNIISKKQCMMVKLEYDELWSNFPARIT